MWLLDTHSQYWGWVEIVINHNAYYVQENPGTYISFEYLQYYKMKNEKVDNLSILQWDWYLCLVTIRSPESHQYESESRADLLDSDVESESLLIEFPNVFFTV